MTDFKLSGAGVVLPSGTPVAVLPPGKHSVAIDGFDESGCVRCVYPDGFIKHHQVEAVDGLAARVVSQIRGRYGVTGEIIVTKLPEALAAGEIIEVEV